MTRGQKLSLAVLLVLFGAGARLVPHLWNAAPITAIALFAGVYLGRSYALTIPVLAMLLSDLFIGFDTGWVTASVYVSFALSGMVGIMLKRVRSTEAVVAASIVSSTLFFLITNFAVWRFGTMYTHDWHGLVMCYTLAVPFFRNTLVGDMGYTSLLFGAYALAREIARLPRGAILQSYR